MFCKNCGQETNNPNHICDNCISNIQQNNIYIADKGGFKYGLLGFLFPIAGIVLYYMLKNQEPKLSNSLIIGSIVNVLFTIIFIILFMINNIITSILFA